MHLKTLISVLFAVAFLAVVHAQNVPAIESLSSKRQSISAYHPTQTAALTSIESAISRISSEMGKGSKPTSTGSPSASPTHSGNAAPVAISTGLFLQTAACVGLFIISFVAVLA